MDEGSQGLFEEGEGWIPESLANINLFTGTCAGNEISRGFRCQMPSRMETSFQQAGIWCNLSLSIWLCVHICWEMESWFAFVFCVSCFRQWIELLQQRKVMWRCSTHLNPYTAWTLWKLVSSSHASRLKLRKSFFKRNGNTQLHSVCAMFFLSMVWGRMEPTIWWSHSASSLVSQLQWALLTLVRPATPERCGLRHWSFAAHGLSGGGSTAFWFYQQGALAEQFLEWLAPWSSYQKCLEFVMY